MDNIDDDIINDGIKLTQYCGTCTINTSINQKKGKFSYQLELDKYHSQKQLIRKSWLCGEKSMLIHLFDYKCPTCNEITTFQFNQQAQKWVRKSLQ